MNPQRGRALSRASGVKGRSTPRSGRRAECSGLGPHTTAPVKKTETLHISMHECKNVSNALCVKRNKVFYANTACSFRGRAKGNETDTNPERKGNELVAMGIPGTPHGNETDIISRDRKQFCSRESGPRPLLCSTAERRSRTTGEIEQRSAVSSVGKCNEMEKYRRVQMGDTQYIQGLQATVRQETPHLHENNIFTRGRSSSRHSTTGGTLPVRQRSHKRGSGGSDEVRFLQPLLPGQKEGGRAPSHTRPKGPQSVPKGVQIQNVDEHEPVASTSSGGLYVHGGSKRCVLSFSDLSATQEIPAIRFPGPIVRVHGTSVRNEFEPPYIRQMHDGSGGPAEASRHSHSDVRRRLVALRRLKSRGGTTYASGDFSSDRSRFPNQLRQMQAGTLTNDRVHRHRTGFSLVHSSPVTRQATVVQGLPSTVSTGPSGPVQNVQEVSGTHGLCHIADTIGQTTNETFPTMDGIATGPLLLSVPTSAGDGGMYGGATTLERPDVPNERSDHGDGNVQTGDHNRCQPDRLGRDPQRTDGQRDMGLQVQNLPYKLLGTSSSVIRTATFSSVSEGTPCAGEVRQYDYRELYQQAGGSSVTCATQVSSRSTCLERAAPVIDQSDSRSRRTEQGGRSVIPGSMPLWGLVPPLGDSGRDLGPLRTAPNRSVCVAGRHEMSFVLFGEGNHVSGVGCVGPRVAERSAVCISPAEPNSADTHESEDARVNNAINSTGMGTLDVRNHTSPVRPAVATPAAQGHVVTGGGRNIPPTSRTSGSLGLARERLNLGTEGLPQSVIDTIQSARARSTRSLYDGKWSVFEAWCEESHILAFQASVKDVLSFLQSLIDKGRAFSTLKVYLAAISACHIGIGDKTVGQHPLVCRFMKGARRLLPVSKSVVPAWDLGLVLDSLTRAPFEPLEEVDMKHLSLKTALLLALVTTKRVSDIHALSVHAECTQFSAGKVTIRPNPAFVPKNPLMQCIPMELREFHPPPFASQEDEKLHCLCPVRALKVYMARSGTRRKSDQLFVSWAPRMVGKPITKQRLSHWIVEAIQLAYSSKGIQPPGALRAHSTRGMSASWALLKGVSIQDVCTAASWASPLTFTRFYSLDVTAPSVAHAVLDVASGRN